MAQERSNPIVGGLVAHNEESTLRAAVRSLQSQSLPAGATWETLWIVASGCTDGTVAIARELAAADDRIRVLVEAERRGKSFALDQVLRQADGRAVVLLNADARAEPGAVAALFERARNHPTPYAVMGRPMVAASVPDEPVARMIGLLWALHHEFHVTSLTDGRGNHLSDELLLVEAPGFSGFPPGIINDGAYLGAWLDAHGGSRLYAPAARVTIQTPTTLADHLRQRRRILVGHAQVRELLGRAPSTLPGLLLSRPREALDILRRTLRDDPGRVLDLGPLVVPELFAAMLAIWDRLPPRRDHVRWERIRAPAPTP